MDGLVANSHDNSRQVSCATSVGTELFEEELSNELNFE